MYSQRQWGQGSLEAPDPSPSLSHPHPQNQPRFPGSRTLRIPRLYHVLLYIWEPVETCCCHRLTHLPCAAIHLIHIVSKAFSHEEHQQPSAITTQCSKPRSSKARPRKPRSSLNPSKTPVLNPTKTSKAKGLYHDWYSGAEEAGARITAAIRGRSSGAQAISHRLSSSSSSSSSSSCGAAPSQEETQRVVSLNTSSLPCAATKKSPEEKLLVWRR